MSSLDNLKEAFAGESQANRRYLAFARRAEEDGYPQVARLFRAAAEAETVHAHNHLRTLGGIKTTLENLQTAIQGEISEYKDMYPRFLEEARKAGDAAAEIVFYQANAVEEIHARLFSDALKSLDAAKDINYWVCHVCGNTVEGAAPDQCPICGAPRESFKEVV